MRRTTRPLLGGLVSVILLMAGSRSGIASDELTKPDPNDPVLIARGKVIYAEQCASCHGANQGETVGRRSLEA